MNSACIPQKAQHTVSEWYSDLAIFGLFFAASAFLSAAIPFSSVVRGVLFPLCAFFLTFRRAVILNLLTWIPEIFASAYKLDPITFGLVIAITGMMLPGQTFGIWLFKRMQERHVIRALSLYYLGTILATVMIVLPVGLTTLYFATYAGIMPSELSLNQALVMPPQTQIVLAEATNVLVNLPPSLIIGALLVVPLGVLGFLILSFIAECYILRSIQRRMRGLPSTFRT